ncbi:MAG: hypothetical protein FWF46_07535 [Oscillospiraceae bacterium]|nr:hypothetical protein [Oscillospiraceae bacterium]
MNILLIILLIIIIIVFTLKYVVLTEENAVLRAVITVKYKQELEYGKKLIAINEIAISNTYNNEKLALRKIKELSNTN